MKKILKLSPRSQGVLHNPTFVVGINPARPLKGNPHLAWTGPRGASLVQRAAKGKNNVYFTNTFNWYVHNSVSSETKMRYRYRGYLELLEDVERLNPNKIICLGFDAFYTVRFFFYDRKIIHLQHPSYVYRFTKDHDAYVKKLRRLL